MKKLIGSRIYTLAIENNVTQVAVSNIISAYLNSCIDEVLSGQVVRVWGLFSLHPSDSGLVFSTTHALRCKQVSEKCQYPYFTTKAILDGYLADCKRDIKDGYTVNFCGVATLTLLKDIQNDRVTPSVSTSKVLRNKAKSLGKIVRAKAYRLDNFGGSF